MNGTPDEEDASGIAQLGLGAFPEAEKLRNSHLESTTS
jgi:hypothetical protein